MKKNAYGVARSEISKKVYIGDFVILTVVFLFLCTTVYLLHKLLYTEEIPNENIIKIVTPPMEKELCALVDEGDEIFDTITKRKVGVVHQVRVEEAEGGYVLVMKILADRNPSGHPLRTKSLWFEYSPLEECDSP